MCRETFWTILSLKRNISTLKAVCHSCLAPIKGFNHIFACLRASTHIHTHTHWERVWRMMCSCQLGVACTHWDLAKVSLAFPLGARCWICIWIQLWGFRFMPVWVVPSRAFFPFTFSLSQLHSLSLLTSPPFTSPFALPHTPLQLLFTTEEVVFDTDFSESHKNSFIISILPLWIILSFTNNNHVIVIYRILSLFYLLKINIFHICPYMKSNIAVHCT